jgi:hypothetical protein
MIWLEMFGNGAQIIMSLVFMKNRNQKPFVLIQLAHQEK